MTVIAADSTPVMHSAPKIAHSARTRVLLEDAIVPTLIRMAWPNVLVMMAQAATGLIETPFANLLPSSISSLASAVLPTNETLV
jgi:hypothetical protein